MVGEKQSNSPRKILYDDDYLMDALYTETYLEPESTEGLTQANIWKQYLQHSFMSIISAKQKLMLREKN